jgi:hypothetical protein
MDSDHQAFLEQVKREWIHDNPTLRKQSLLSYPELAEMGLSVDDPYEPDPDDMKEWEHPQ